MKAFTQNRKEGDTHRHKIACNFRRHPLKQVFVKY